MIDVKNPITDQIKALVGGSLANKVEAPEETDEPKPAPVTEETPIVDEEADFLRPQRPTSNLWGDDTRVDTPKEPKEDTSSLDAGFTAEVDGITGLQSDEDVLQVVKPLEELQDPVSYNARRFQKVTPYVVTMSNGDLFETDTLDREKIMYDYRSQFRQRFLKDRQRTWEEIKRDANMPTGAALHAKLADTADSIYFGYMETPKGIRESLAGAAGRAFVNTITNAPFNVLNLFNLAALGVADAVGATETAEKIQQEISDVEATKRDVTAHPSYYWANTEDTLWRTIGSGVGSIAASVIPAYMTSGASLAVNAASKAGTKAATKAITKRMGKEAAEKAGEKAIEAKAKRLINIRNYVRDPKFDPNAAKDALALTYSNRITNSANYFIAASEAADAAYRVYEDALTKTNDIGLSVGRALSTGGLVGLLGAAPDFVHGAFGAMYDTSRKLWAAALDGNEAGLRKLLAGDIALAGALEGASEVAQDIAVASATNEPFDVVDEAIVFLLAGIMAGGTGVVSNWNSTTNAINNAKEYKTNLRAYVKTMADLLNKSLPKGSSRIITEREIDRMMRIVGNADFVGLGRKIVKKGLMENIDKMDGMTDAEKRSFKEALNNKEVDVSAEAFKELDQEIDRTYLKGVTGLTNSQKMILKSILHGAARYAILTRKISRPVDLVNGQTSLPIGLMGITTEGQGSYIEGLNVNIGTEGGANKMPYRAGKVAVDPNADPAMQMSAKINNQIGKSATKGMTQGAVDILHEILGHMFASDTVLGGDLPMFLVKYTELLQEAIAEVFPNVDISQATAEELDEYRAYAMANSTKIAEMLGFKGDMAKLFSFFEQMVLADGANFGGIQDYVQTLRALLQENSEAIRGLIDIYQGDLPAAVRYYAETGNAGVLKEEHLRALSRVFQSGLADADAKIDLMSIIGDQNNYELLTERLNKIEITGLNNAIEQDKKDAQYAISKLRKDVAKVKTNIKDSPKAPVNREVLDVLEEKAKKAQRPNDDDARLRVMMQIEELNRQIDKIENGAAAAHTLAMEELGKDHPGADEAYEEHIAKASKEIDDKYNEAIKEAEPLKKQRDDLQKLLDSGLPLVNNEKTFDKKTGKYFYLTKRPLIMPDASAVPEVKHQKGDNEVGSGDKETYRASQLATTGLTKDELDGLIAFALKEIRTDFSTIFDPLLKAIDNIVEDDTKPVVPFRMKDEHGRSAGYMFKYYGALDLGGSQIVLDSATAHDNSGDLPTGRLSSNIAYYVMAKRAAKANNRRYTVREINAGLDEILKDVQLSEGAQIEDVFSETALTDDEELVAVANKLRDYEEDYHAFTGNTEYDNNLYKTLLTRLEDLLSRTERDVSVVVGGGTSTSRQKLLADTGDWYETLYDTIMRELSGGSVYDSTSGGKRKGTIGGAKSRIKNAFNLSEKAIAELDSLKKTDEVINFLHAHSNEYKYLGKSLTPFLKPINDKLQEKDLEGAKALIKEDFKLDEKAVAKLDSLKSVTAVKKFMEEHKDSYVGKKIANIPDMRTVNLSTLIGEELDSLAKAEVGIQFMPDFGAKNEPLTKKQARKRAEGNKNWASLSKEEHDKAVAKFVKAHQTPKVDDKTPLDKLTDVYMDIYRGEGYVGFEFGEQDNSLRDLGIAPVKDSGDATKPFVFDEVDEYFSKKGVKDYNPLTNFKAQVGFATNEAKTKDAYETEDMEESLLTIKDTEPEDYGFNGENHMQYIFDRFEVPQVSFDTDNYLYASKTGKTKKDKFFYLSDFLIDYADMAIKGVKELTGNKTVLSPRDKLIYIRAVMDANAEARRAYDEYAKEVLGGELRSSTMGNQLLGPDGYQKYLDEAASNDGLTVRDLLLFRDMDTNATDAMFIGYTQEQLHLVPTTDTNELRLGSVIIFPYGKNYRAGMIVLDAPISGRKILINGRKITDHQYLIRAAHTDTNGNTRYSELFVPLSDFIEMVGQSKSFMVSNVPLDDAARNAFYLAFNQKLADQGSKNLFKEVLPDMVLANQRRATPAIGRSPQKNLENKLASEEWKTNRRYTVAESISKEMADILKQLSAEADEEVAAGIIATDPHGSYMDEGKYKTTLTSQKLIDFSYRPETVDHAFTAEDLKAALEANEMVNGMAKQSVEQFAKAPFMGTMNFVDFMTDLADKADANRSTKFMHKIALGLGSVTSPDKPWRMVFGEDPLGISTVESAQIMTQQSEMATEKLQAQIVKSLEDIAKKNGKKTSTTFNEFFRNRLTNSPLKAELYDGRKVDITRGEIHTIYAAKLVETTKGEKAGKYKYEQSAIDGGNHIYSRLQKTYKNAEQLIEQLTDAEKKVVEDMLDFFTNYTAQQKKRFILSLGSYPKSTEKDWKLRHQYFARATKAEMTDMDSLLIAGDLFDTLNDDFKANAIYDSGVKKNLTTMKNMLVFSSKYRNAEDGESGFERFLRDFKLRSENEAADKALFEKMLTASERLRNSVKETLGSFGFERFMKRLDQDEMKPAAAMKLLPSWLGRRVEQTTRSAMSSALAFKPKNAVLNFVGVWQRLAPLSNNTLRWYTTDLLDAIINSKTAIKEAMDMPFIAQRYSRNALGTEYQKVTDVNSVETLLADLSVWAKNKKANGLVSWSEILGKLDDVAKKMTKISVGYGTSGADFLALAFGWHMLKPSLREQAKAQTKANYAAGRGKGRVTAERLFMNHVLRTISSSNFMTRSSLQNWAIRNHLGALTAFLNDSLQSYSAIGEAWYMYHSAKTDAEKRYLRKIITSNIASQAFYVASQIGAFSALYGLAFTDDGLTDAEEEYIWDSLWREMIGQLSSVTPLDQFTRPVLESLFLDEKRTSSNIFVKKWQDLASAIHDGDPLKMLTTSSDFLLGFSGAERAVEIADAMFDAYTKDDMSYKIAGEVLFGRSKNTAMKMQGLRENSKGKIVEKK